MPKAARVANARAAAQSYAPSPNGSAITYGLIAAALVLVAAIIVGAFYRVDVLSGVWPIGLLTLVAFFAGAALRVLRRHAHDRAFTAEYDSRLPVSPVGGARAAASPVVGVGGTEAPPAATVTFHSAFLLPGLDHPHPAGTFELRERREALDVSFDASIVTRTIMLTSGGRTEALDVKADDLAAALELDSRKLA